MSLLPVPPTEGAAESSHLDAFLKSNPASTGVMAGVVTMSGQLAAQFGLPGLGCRIIALLFALLLAGYQVGIAQRRPLRESMLLVPIVSVILFTTGWGANGLIYETRHEIHPPHVASAEASPTQPPLVEWVAEQIVPAAYAQDGGRGNDRGSDRDRGGWKKW
jgi:hypothetical protein